MKIIECPRDAMQGIVEFIDTDQKAAYINQLLKVGFDTIDFGSFVSPKAIPQMRDTADVLAKLDLGTTKSKLLAIIANVRGAADAAQFEEIDYLGFPFSISETFQLRNTNKTIVQALEELAKIQEVVVQNNKAVVAYISMGFGNPYNDVYNVDLVGKYTEKLSDLGVKIISVSDTIGNAKPQQIEDIFPVLMRAFPEVEFGAHLHSTPDTSMVKIEAMIKANVQRIDSAMRGFGGCPMAKDDLTGNLATEQLIAVLEANKKELGLDKSEFKKSLTMAGEVFPN